MSLLAKLAIMIGAGLMAAGTVAQEKAPEVWIDAAALTIEGRGWSDSELPYDRLPARAKGVVPPAVWTLSKQSAGIAVRFACTSKTIRVRWSLTSASLAMPHMPATGVSGVDLYVRAKDGGWRFAQNARPGGETTVAQLSPGGANDAPVECRLYLPLYNGVRKLEILPGEGGSVAPVAAGEVRPIVVYGTSIVQGGCASRPGTAWPTILARMVDVPVVNLGFSGSGRIEPAVTGFFGELDASLFIIDCLWNVGGDAAEQLEDRIGSLVKSIRTSRPDTPILFVGMSHIDPRAHPAGLSERQARAARKLSDSGVKGLHVVGGEALVGADGEATVDGCHPTDLGMMRQAEALRRVVARLLGGRAGGQRG